MENKDLFSEIRDAAQAWEEPYEQGAWEDFSREHKRRRGLVIFWRYLGVAAMFLFLLLGGLLYNHQPEINNAHKQLTSNSPQKKPLKSSPVLTDTKLSKNITMANALHTTNKNNTVAGAVQAQIVSSKKLINAHIVNLPDTIKDKRIVINTKSHPKLRNNNHLQTLTSPDTVNTGTTKNNTSLHIIAVAPVKKIPLGSHSLYDSLTNHIAEDKKKINHNLTYALAINPSVGNKKVSFGAGLEVFYPVNDRLSLGSGLGFASLHAETENSGSNAITQVQGSNLDINGIELPINFKYQVNGGFYVNAGISAVAILNNQLAYHYFTPTTQTITQFDGKGSPHEAIQLASAKSTEQSKEHLGHYIGFYTFSAGKKQTFGKGQLNFGPFIKVPFNPISSQNIRFTQGGFSVSVSF